MNRVCWKTFIFIPCLLFAASHRLQALDIDASFNFGNLLFSSTRTSDDTTFSGTDFLSALSFQSSWEVMENITIEAGYTSEVVLRNILYALLHYQEGALLFSVGPFLGLLNTSGTVFQSGISTRVKIEVPDLIFLSINGDNTIGGELVQIGDYIQEKNEILLGYILGTTVFSAGVSSERFTQKTEEEVDVIDTVNQYSFRTKFAQEQLYFSATLCLSYRLLSKSFIHSTVVTKHTLNNVVIGVDFRSRIMEDIMFQIDMETGLVAWGADYLQAFPLTWYPPGNLLRLKFGIEAHLDRIFEYWSGS